MSATRSLGRTSRLALLVAASGLALAACQQNAPAANNATAPPPLAALPLAMDSTNTAIADAPPADALPPAAQPVKVGRLADPRAAYAFADRAAEMNAGFGDAPPDYTFDNGGGQRPWVWRANDQSYRIAEPLPGGAYRYYYYEPGASAPYLVRDSGYSYGYDNGALVAVYGPDGGLLPSDEADRQADIAGRFLARAEAMREAADRSQHEAVEEANWQARRQEIADQRAQWAANQQADADWRAYHDAHAQQDDAYWAAERYRRQMEAAQFARQINDAQAAQRELDDARRAQALVAGGPPPRPAAGPQGYGQPGGYGQPAGFGQPGGHPGGYEQPGGYGPPQGAPGQPMPDRARTQLIGGPQGAQANADAQHRAQLMAQQQQHQAASQAAANAAAQHRAQLLASQQQQQQQAQLLAAQHQAASQAAANAAAQHRAQLLASQQQQQQAQAAHQAQLLAAQHQAASQAAANAAAQHRAQLLASQQAQAAAAAKAAAARKAAQAGAGRATNSTGNGRESPRGQQQ